MGYSDVRLVGMRNHNDNVALLSLPLKFAAQGIEVAAFVDVTNVDFRIKSDCGKYR